MRLAVYTDYEYRSDGERRYGQRAFVIFLEALRPHVDRLVLVGRLDPKPGRSHYPLHEDTELVGLPHYASLARPWSVVRSLLASAHRFWRLLDEVDTVWVLGPYPHAIMFALIAALRRRRVVLGVRQDTSVYIRSRRPGQRWMHVGADLLEAVWKLLARRHAVVVVGPELARKYKHARRVLAINVSLVTAKEVISAEDLHEKSYEQELIVLTVGRLDSEKNPLLLADVMALLQAGEHSWRIIVCGDGPMRPQLEGRLAELGVLDNVELRGYVPIDDGLLELYRRSHMFLHVSWTEGFPQVLIEAFAAGLPVVATAVGGVPAAAEGTALLVPPGDPQAAADALGQLAADSGLREQLVSGALERARGCTLEAETERLAQFIGTAPLVGSIRSGQE
ncbi:MAG: glycosyltransferase [Solirubrobacteraceae bacterium]